MFSDNVFCLHELHRMSGLYWSCELSGFTRNTATLRDKNRKKQITLFATKPEHKLINCGKFYTLNIICRCLTLRLYLNVPLFCNYEIAGKMKQSTIIFRMIWYSEHSYIRSRALILILVFFCDIPSSLSKGQLFNQGS